MDVAVIGMSCRLPGANNYKEFWGNLISGKTSIKEIPASRWDWYSYDGNPRKQENRTNIHYGGFIDAIDKFDPKFFGIAPKEAGYMDPQHRIFIEAVWQAIEDAGYRMSALSGKNIGVFAGVSKYDYSELMRRDRVDISPYMSTGTTHSMLANRVSYLFNLQGNSQSIDTASSSSAVALHYAVRDLESGECESAIVGGVNALLSPTTYISHSKAGMLSVDGRCYSFDKRANGYVRAEGVGVLYIKPLDKALNDSDNILAVIKSTAINHSGRSDSLTAPSIDGQVRVIDKALKQGDIDPFTVGYIETHGSGTPLGDPIEIQALKKAYIKPTSINGPFSDGQRCALSSVKSNIGHLESAAGIAGIIKAILALKHKKIPKIATYNTLNPEINLEGSHFFIADKTLSWNPMADENGQVLPRRSGVTSLGLGGVNAHIILEEAPSFTRQQNQHKKRIFLLSARKGGLKKQAKNLHQFLKQHPEMAHRLDDVQFILSTGREYFEHRLAVVCDDFDTLKKTLQAYIADENHPSLLLSEGDLKGDNTILVDMQDDLSSNALSWVNGADLDWSNYYTQETVVRDGLKRISLPGYIFDRKRCWYTDKTESFTPPDELKSASVATCVNKGITEKGSDYNVNSLSTFLCSIFSGSFGISFDEVEPDEFFESYGINSIMIQELNVVLVEHFGQVSKTLFFECRTINAVAEYLIEKHSESVKRIFAQGSGEKGKVVLDNTNEEDRPLLKESKSIAPAINTLANEDIAIIGLGGRYPQSQSIDEFWQNLKKGYNAITDIPAGHFSYEEHFNENIDAERIYCKRGSFIEHVDKFDADFFGISPREAELIDPQERLLLEVMWSMLEDAGYTRQKLYEASKKSVGVFVGAFWVPYLALGVEQTAFGNNQAPSGHLYSIANRISYFLDIHGPSMAVDTACSGSLTAIHLACQSIKSGESKMAIAAGVNLSLHNSKYLFLCKNQFLSTEGLCRAFGEGGGGYVPGEGIGSILLRPLKDAVADGDNIWGVIKGSAINHGGRTHGYTVPNPNAQGDLIKQALENSGVDPLSINYVEAHGTGTSLGDPIEIVGLTNAYQQWTNKKQYCAIGSLKSNIGHLEAAAGIAGLTKVLLQMRNKILVPSLHAEKLNSNIDFSDTPFSVQRTLEKWEKPTLVEEGKLLVQTRKAGLSSFGAGGANAHLVIEEWGNTEAIQNESLQNEDGNTICVFSAKDIERLQEYLCNIQLYLTKNTDVNLYDLARTFREGREAMECRLAMVVQSIEELEQKLVAFKSPYVLKELMAGGETKGMSASKLSYKKLKVSEVVIDYEIVKREQCKIFFQDKAFNKICQAWVYGLDVDWSPLSPGARIISLPTYPFAKQRYWLPGLLDSSTQVKAKFDLLDEQSSSFAEKNDNDILLCAPSWTLKVASSSNQETIENLVVFYFEDEQKVALEHQLTALTQTSVLWLKLSGATREISVNSWEVNIDQPSTLELILKDVSACQPKLLFLWPWSENKRNIIDVGLKLEAVKPFFSLIKTVINVLSRIDSLTFVSMSEFQHTTTLPSIYESVGASMRTLGLLGISARNLVVDASCSDNQDFAQAVCQELLEDSSSNCYEVLYKKQQRFVKSISKITLESAVNVEGFKTGGIYLITGGAGSLGKHVAEFLVKKYKAKVVLTGRSPLDENKTQLLTRLREAGGHAQYYRSRIENIQECNKLITDTLAKFGALHGVIHAAGVFDESTMIHQKNWPLILETLNPKLVGSRNLDIATREIELDFFVLFSSISSLIGDFGSCDYAIANRMLDDFSVLREQSRAQEQRKGRTISVNWPLWSDGGMMVDRVKQKEYTASSGLGVLDTEQGLLLLENIIKSDAQQVAVFFGNTQRLEKMLDLQPASNNKILAVTTEKPSEKASAESTILVDKISFIASALLKIDRDKFEKDRDFHAYGFGSIAFKRFAYQLAETFQVNISPTLFYDCTDTIQVAEYLQIHHRDAVNSCLVNELDSSSIREKEGNSDNAYIIDDIKNIVAKQLKITVKNLKTDMGFQEQGFDSIRLKLLARDISQHYEIDLMPSTFFVYDTVDSLVLHLQETYSSIGENILPDQHSSNPEMNVKTPNLNNVDKSNKKTKSVDQDDIAVIGIGANLPASKNLIEFWQHLEQEHDLITEVPSERWNWHEYDGDPKEDRSKTNSHWGGFINDMDKFDPLFFNISPKEAEMMDPQQRLFLQAVWHTIEDAGYKVTELNKHPVGLYVGVQFQEYQSLINRYCKEGNPQIITGNFHSILANRVSYLLDLKGPSEAIDTACSASLVAMTHAINAIKNKQCEYAIAGGVSLALIPETYVYTSQMGILSSDGRCKTFDKSANGYVKGEGVGAVLLKPLSRAIEDKDHIYGVIKSAVASHAGRSSSMTAPSAKAQADLITKAYKEADIPIESLGYIEAHGTGTELGDPVEVEGLKLAFAQLSKEQTGKKNYCGLGSVKSNIGHLEPAAGITGLIKLLLSLRYKKLPASLHIREVNPYIQLENSPFYLVRHTQNWSPVLDNDGNNLPRRAGVSSFGFGGVNSHVVVEEYIEKISRQSYPIDNPSNSQIIVLSAKTEESLNDSIATLLEFLQYPDEWLGMDNNLINIAYTLQSGREEMQHRFAAVISSIKELISVLEISLGGGISVGKSVQARVEEDAQITLSDEEITSCDLKTLASKWVKGACIDWKVLHGLTSLQKVILPGYPFAKERYWLDVSEVKPQQNTVQKKVVINSSVTQVSVNQTQDSNAKPQDLKVVRKNWQQVSLPASNNSISSDSQIVVLVNGESRSLIKRLNYIWTGQPLIVVHVDDNNYGDHSQYYSLPKTPQTNDDWFVQLGINFASPVYVFDMADIVNEDKSRDIYANQRISFYQTLLKLGRSTSLRILHITRCLQEWRNTRLTMSGALVSSLVRMLAAEYKMISATTVDMGPSDIEQCLQDGLLLRELTTPVGVSEVCYRDGVRYEPFLQQQDFEISFDSYIYNTKRPVVITGGTRGIGAEIAKCCVARGIRQLILIGRESLPARASWTQHIEDTNTSQRLRNKIQLIIDLENKGATVEVYFGELTDESALRCYFDEVKHRFGGVGGVIHCAGLTRDDHPAFIMKSEADFTEVLQPKVDGLEALNQVLYSHHLDYFLCFSSVSALIPKLAVGLSDYVMANAYMDKFAVYNSKESKKTGRKTLYKSIQWPSWKEVGMGENQGEVYLGLGLLSHTTTQGLTLFDGVCTQTSPEVSMPCVVDPQKFDISGLLISNQNCHHKSESALLDRQKKYSVNVNGVDNVNVNEFIKEKFSETLKIPKNRIDVRTNFSNYGVDSIVLVELIRMIEKSFDINIDATVFLEHTTIEKLSEYLQDNFETQVQKVIGQKTEKHQITPVDVSPKIDRRVAVIGIGCHLPKSPDKNAFWNNLKAGTDCISEVPDSRWSKEELYYPAYKKDAIISQWGGFVEGVENFDPEYFGIHEDDAIFTDPLERMFLETSVQTLRDAGYDKDGLWGKDVGVFVGTRVANYAQRFSSVKRNSIIGLGQNFIAAHISHILNFKGPSMVIDTACSSSLVSVHMACQSLLMGECEVALAGGSDYLLDEKNYLILSESKALSPDGKCHTFDEKANGFVPGEGCGAVLLKPLQKALDDGNIIYGVIDGSAVNNDGNTMGVTTPNPEAQQNVIRKALKNANVDPSTVTFLEAHGTGTMIGDPIELRALTNVFRDYTDSKQYCGIGSVKTNIGHTLSAAGVASLIKVLLSISHQQLPPTLNCESPNPRFDFASSPFYIQSVLKDWVSEQGVLRAGISSFGFGGTNAHLIVSNGGNEMQRRYTPKMKSLPPIVFNRKRFWIERNKKSKELRQLQQERSLHLNAMFELVDVD